MVYCVYCILGLSLSYCTTPPLFFHVTVPSWCYFVLHCIVMCYVVYYVNFFGATKKLISFRDKVHIYLSNLFSTVIPSSITPKPLIEWEQASPSPFTSNFHISFSFVHFTGQLCASSNNWISLGSTPTTPIVFPAGTWFVMWFWMRMKTRRCSSWLFPIPWTVIVLLLFGGTSWQCFFMCL